MATRMYVCESAEHPSSLLMGLNEQRQQGQLCDVTVRVQGHLFKAHTNVLASAMGYFRDLFLNPSKQMKKEIIEIPTIVNSIGFSKVLDFIYTSQLCLSQTTVMQVLCSACYLQIPYVVDKCQEFIVTHGHVSLQGAFPPALTDQRYVSDKAPHSNQECELINTPPSPGNLPRSVEEGMTGSPPGNDQSHDLSPGGSMGKVNGVGVGVCTDGEQTPGGGMNAASRALMQMSNQSRLSALSVLPSSPRNGAELKITQQNGEAEGVPDSDIDHESLADYFVRNGIPTTSDNSLALTTFVNSSSPAAMDQHLYSVAKGIYSAANQGKDLVASPASSVSQYLLSVKKEKPKKEYRCEYCQKLFGRQQHLKRHILTHTGERPFPCQLCDKKFRRSEHLKHHLVKHQQNPSMNTASGGTATFVDLSTVRKRPRKAVMPANAYGMSKMMLVSYNNQMTLGEHSPASENKGTENNLLGSPTVIAKLDAGSALDSISERLAFAAAQRGGPIEPEQNMNTVPYPADAGSPMALNLSSRAVSHTTFNNGNMGDASRAPVDLASENAESGQSTRTRPKDAQENEILASESSDSKAICDETNNGTGDETMVNGDGAKLSPQRDEPAQENSVNHMSIDSFATSEVVTQDLKRLFAAMDE